MQRRPRSAIVIFGIVNVLVTLALTGCAAGLKPQAPSTDTATVNAREAAKKAQDTGKAP